MPPNLPRTLAPAARAKNAFGILFSPPNRKNAARSLFYCNLVLFWTLTLRKRTWTLAVNAFGQGWVGVTNVKYLFIKEMADLCCPYL